MQYQLSRSPFINFNFNININIAIIAYQYFLINALCTSDLLNSNATFRTRSMNSCYRPTKLPLPKFHSNIFTEPPKYVKLHVIAGICQNSPEMTEQCSRCSMPTGS